MFPSFFLKSFRILLFPFSLLYWFGIGVRNFLYDKQWLKSTPFGLPLICVGNLSVGGTGKSPMVEYLIRLLDGPYRVATLSRGYKRKTKGYALADDQSTALDIGDEPMQFHQKFPGVPVAVGEERLVAIPQLLHDHPDTEVIVLDDAFQHRAIRAGLNILLTEYGNLFTRDFYLPAGDLRDLKRSYKRAGIIVVTKCRPDLGPEERERIRAEINPLAHQSLFFACTEYGIPYHFLSGEKKQFETDTEILLVSGIANPRPLKSMLEEKHNGYQMLQFPDHHIFSIDDWREIVKRFGSIQATNKIILTTEKDAVRLRKFREEASGIPLFVIPVSHRFLFNEGKNFEEQVTCFVRDFKNESH